MKKTHIKALFLVAFFSFNASAQSVPPITSGETYPSYREKLVKEGWIPVKRGNQCGYTCKSLRTDGYVETENCGDAGIAPCTFIFKNKDSVVLKIHTVGENLGVQKTVGGGPSTPPPKTSETSASVQRKTNQSTNSSSPSGLAVDTSSRGSALGSCAGIMHGAAIKRDGAVGAKFVNYFERYMDSAPSLAYNEYKKFDSAYRNFFSQAQRSDVQSLEAAAYKCINNVR